MAVYMVTSWSPYDKAEDAGKIMAKVGKMPSYIKKWRTFVTPDGKRGIKGYNIIYIEDDNIIRTDPHISIKI